MIRIFLLWVLQWEVFQFLTAALESHLWILWCHHQADSLKKSSVFSTFHWRWNIWKIYKFLSFPVQSCLSDWKELICLMSQHLQWVSHLGSNGKSQQLNSFLQIITIKISFKSSSSIAFMCLYHPLTSQDQLSESSQCDCFWMMELYWM